MDEVYIIAAGHIPVGKYPESNPAKLGGEAVVNALANADIAPEMIGALYAGNMLSGILSDQQLLATLIANNAGLTTCEAITAEGACGSGAAAMRLGVMAVASGCHKAVVVCGAEQMTHKDHAAVTHGLATGSHWPSEGGEGKTFISLNAALMQAYMSAYDIEHEAFANFSISAHANGYNSPHAMLHKLIDKETYINGRELTAPITLFDAPPICDGAAALILVNKDIAMAARATGQPIVKVLASSASTDKLAIKERESLLELKASRIGGQMAYQQAGITPADLDFLELHDAYTIMNTLSLEALGFADRGHGTELAVNEQITLNGEIPISTFGGLKSRGHPVGATGVYQLVECFLQLTDRAGENQVKGAEVGLAQSFGGAASSAFTHILAAA
ncbi:thiolase domain-containing protein [Maricurvus nonylphenolicus]|uniref:thiolase C-terminal domain-containing protein n=1 Tax=Maricurvus nonylphenolicus TaxID=1008307 RepID=UPI0036F2E306